MHMHIWSWISVNAKRKSGKMHAGNLHEMKARKKNENTYDDQHENNWPKSI